MTQKSLVFAVPGKKGTYSTKNLSEEDVRRLLDANSKDEPMGDLKSFAKRMEATGVKR